jgi:hypothetical protein
MDGLVAASQRVLAAWNCWRTLPRFARTAVGLVCAASKGGTNSDYYGCERKKDPFSQLL